MILVTGGTGLVGAHLLCKLAQENVSIRAIYRNKDSISKTYRLFERKKILPYWKQIQWVEADVTHLPQLTEAFNGISEVYHCAAMVSFMSSDFSKMSKVNIEGTANLVNLSLDFGIKKFCYVSSIATLDEVNKNTHLLDETSEWNPNLKHSDYAITKNGGEIEVWRAIQEGLPAVIINPGVILGFGFEDQGSGLIIKQIDKGLPFYTEGIMPIIAIDDVVDAMCYLMQNNVLNQRFVLVADNASIKDVFSSIAKKIGKQAPHYSLPKTLFKIAAVTDGILTTIIPNKKRSLTLDLVQTSYSKQKYDSSKYTSLVKKPFLTLQEYLDYYFNESPYS